MKKSLSILLLLCMLIGMFGGVSAFAAEGEESVGDDIAVLDIIEDTEEVNEPEQEGPAAEETPVEEAPDENGGVPSAAEEQVVAEEAEDNASEEPELELAEELPGDGVVNEVSVTTTEGLQDALDNAVEGTTINVAEGEYDVVYLRNNTTNANRILKDVTVKAAAGTKIKQFASAVTSTAYLDIENLTIDGFTFSDPNYTGVWFDYNSDGTHGFLRVNGLTIQNCTKVGDKSKGTSGYEYHTFAAFCYDAGNCPETYAGDTSLACGYHNITIQNNTITKVYWPITFPQNSLKSNLKIINNTFDDCLDNHIQVSGSGNQIYGTNIISGNTIKNMSGRFARIAGAAASAAFTIENNTVIAPKVFDTGDSGIGTDGDGTILKITGSQGFTVTDNNNTWTRKEYTDTTTWKAWGALTEVCKIGETRYTSIEDALDAAQSGDTIELLCDVELPWSDSKVSLNVNKAVTIDGAGYTISPKVVSTEWDKYKVGSSSPNDQIFGTYNLITVSADNVTLKNMTIDIKDYRGLSCATTKGGSNVLYENITMKGRGSGHYYGSAAGLVTFRNCSILTMGYAIHFGGSNHETVVIENCTLYGWNSFGKCTSVTVSDTYFGAANDENKNGVFALFRPYCTTTLTGCTFSKEFVEEYMKTTAAGTYYAIGLGTGAAATVTLKGCKVEDGSDIIDIVNYQAPSGKESGFQYASAAQGSLFIFDTIVDANSKYVAGTFVTKDATVTEATLTAKCADGSAAVQVRKATETGDNAHTDGVGAVYIVGKGAEGSELKITAGKFATDPAKYINTEAYEVVPSGDNECPFMVQAKASSGTPTAQQEIVHEKTEAAIVAEIPEAEVEVVEQAAEKTEVTGMTNALTESGKEALLAKSGIDTTKKNDATLIEYEITAKATVIESNQSNKESGTLAFEVKPYATISTHEDGKVTAIKENVLVDNSYFNGIPIQVTIGCAEIVPKQVVHICDDETVEIFKLGPEASYKNKTFFYDDEAKTVTVEITHFSEIAVLGSALFANITFDANGGTGTMEPQVAELGEPTELNACTFTREGYTFAGWSLTKDGETVESVTVSEDITVYAKWTAKSTSASDAKKQAPSTGDNNALGLWIGLASLSVVAMGVALTVKRKEN